MTNQKINTELIPFGKYQGQPIDILNTDVQYKEWLLSQDWFRTKFQTQYNIIVNNFGAPTETPEHNKIQIKFLSPEFCLKFIIAASCVNKKIDLSYFGYGKNCDFCKQLLKNTNKYIGYGEGNIIDSDSGKTFSTTIQFRRFLGKPIIESNDGYDVVFGIDSFVEFLSNVSLIYGYKQYCGFIFSIEIKPIISEDYPSILRQIKNRKGSKGSYLLVDKINSTTVSEKQLSQYFESANIYLIKLSDVENTKINDSLLYLLDNEWHKEICSYCDNQQFKNNKIETNPKNKTERTPAIEKIIKEIEQMVGNKNG